LVWEVAIFRLSAMRLHIFGLNKEGDCKAFSRGENWIVWAEKIKGEIIYYKIWDELKSGGSGSGNCPGKSCSLLSENGSTPVGFRNGLPK